MLSKRLSLIKASPTLSINSKASELKKNGVNVIDFSVGEPDFKTPKIVKEECIKAIKANFTKYVANDGIPELKSAIKQKLETENGITYELNEIIVSPGAKSCLFNLSLALFDKGDEVIIPTPCWVSYPEQVKLASANPVFLKCREKNGFKLDVDELSSLITRRTKALILNYPSNPTGAVYTKSELMEIAEVCLKNKIWIISDEIYEKIVYDGIEFVSIASLGEDIKKKTILINGFSKAYSMTGWRLGYACGPKKIISAMATIQSHNTSNATSFVQYAAVAALKFCSKEVEEMRMEFKRRRDLIYEGLKGIDGINVVKPKGAFYILPNIKNFLKKSADGKILRNTVSLSMYLLEKAKVAVVPGEAFFTKEHIRISFATSMDEIKKGLERIKEALSGLK